MVAARPAVAGAGAAWVPNEAFPLKIRATKGNTMSTCIIGGGLAGIALAVNLKLAGVEDEVLLITDGNPSNTRMAGQRYRSRVVGHSGDPVERLVELFAARNDGVATPAMQTFAVLSVAEIARWISLQPRNFHVDLPPLAHEDCVDWFGPQVGAANAAGFGRGNLLMQWLGEFADGLGIRTLQGTVTALRMQSNRIEHVVATIRRSDGALESHALGADHYVLAGGNPGGRMFHSTNVEIQRSPHELVWRAGLKLCDLHLIMFHIFGNCDRHGHARVGCFETDLLDACRIYLPGKDGRYDYLDEETTALLGKHKAHYRFDEISKRIIEHGGVVRIAFPDQTDKFARVSHHYSHLAVETVDGVAVTGASNLFAIGDAAGTGYWCGHRVRYPGVALPNCLVGAALACDALMRRRHASHRVTQEALPFAPTDVSLVQMAGSAERLKQINTRGVFGYTFSPDPEGACLEWIDALTTIWAVVDGCDPLLEISLATAFSCHDAASGHPPVVAVRRSDLAHRFDLSRCESGGPCSDRRLAKSTYHLDEPGLTNDHQSTIQNLIRTVC